MNTLLPCARSFDAYEVRSGVVLADLADVDHRKKREDEDAFDENGEARVRAASEDESEIESVEAEAFLVCEACKKTFKSPAQYENHLQSKAHKKKAGNAPMPSSASYKKEEADFDARFFSTTAAAETAAEHDAAPGGADGVEGLHALLEEARLMESYDAALTVCAHLGADSVRELVDAECEQDFVEALALPKVKAKRLEKALAALRETPPHPPPPPPAPTAAPAASEDEDEDDATTAATAAAAAASDDDDAAAASDDGDGDDDDDRAEPVVESVRAAAAAVVPEDAPKQKKSRRRKKDVSETSAAAAAPPQTAPAASRKKGAGKKGKKGNRRGCESSDEDDGMSCKRCYLRFASKTKLFDHLKANPSHAALL